MRRAGPSPLVFAPLIAGAAAIGLGRTPAGTVLLALGFVRVHILLWPAVDRAIDRGMHVVVRDGVAMLANVVLGLGAVLVIAPAGIASRVLRLDVLGRGVRPSWRAAAGPAPAARSYSVTTSPGPEPPRRRGVRLALAVLAFAALAAAVQGGGTLTIDPSVPTGGSHQVAALRDQAEVAAMQAEEGAVFDALQPDRSLGWTLPEHVDGTVVSVRSGTRATPASADRGPRVWLFGGSTAWGSGQRDAHTIASEVARLSAADGEPLQIVNWGVFAYTSAQEARAFARAVEVRGAPDLVVFYDGYNDVEVGMGAQLQGIGPGSQVIAPLDVLEIDPVLHRAPGPPASTTAARADGIVSAYRRAMASARAVAEAHDVAMVQVWHPNAFTRTLTADERADLERLGYSPFVREAHVDLHRTVRDRLPDEVVDLADTLDDAPTVYVDQVHTNERGARIVAEALYGVLRPALGACC